MAASDVLRPPRPELEAYRESLHLEVPELVGKLVEHIGRKLTAYVGGVKDVRAVDRWINGGELYNDAEQRLRFTYKVVRMLAQREKSRIIQAWLIGLNPELGDRSPVKLLREGDLDTVAPAIMGAARSFLIGG